MKRRWFSLGYIACLATLAVLGVLAAGALANDPGGALPCSHGSTDKPCWPDPSTNGKDCDPHGNQDPGGVNEDHCLAASPPPTTTTVSVSTQTQTTTLPGQTIVTPPSTVTAGGSTVTTPAVTVTGPTQTVKTKAVTKTKIVYRTRIVRLRRSGTCVCPSGYRLFHGTCHPIARGKG